MLNILLQHDQRRTRSGAIEYVLHATLICNPIALEIIEEHGLKKKTLFEVPEVDAHRQQAQQAFDRSFDRSIFKSQDAGKIIIDNLTGAVHFARSKLAFSITVADALSGTSISCPHLDEIVACERQISEAFDALYRDVTNAMNFSTRQEHVLAPDGDEDMTIINPGIGVTRSIGGGTADGQDSFIKYDPTDTH